MLLLAERPIRCDCVNEIEQHGFPAGLILDVRRDDWTNIGEGFYLWDFYRVVCFDSYLGRFPQHFFLLPSLLCAGFCRMICLMEPILVEEFPDDLTSEIRIEGKLHFTIAFISTPHSQPLYSIPQ